MKLRNMEFADLNLAMEIIDGAKKHLRDQGIDQWQTGYPDFACLERDCQNKKGYFAVDEDTVWGYLCIDFDGEPAYDGLNGNWAKNEKYVVVHRMALAENVRGANLSTEIFKLVEEYAKTKGINYFRVDTDGDNKKMQHILNKNGFTYRGTIWFDNSEKIAFDKTF